MMLRLLDRIRAAQNLTTAISAHRKPRREDLVAAGLPAEFADRFPQRR
ncbi:MAG: hypothetical protein AAGL24_19065 [Pseudomonadota bacterium]